MFVYVGNKCINPEFVASMEWERTFYANCAGDSVLVIRMADGKTHRVKHNPYALDAIDAYQIERRIREFQGS